MAKPTDLPTWNTGGSNRSEPDAGLKASGYPVDAVPTSGNWNWLFFTIYSWILWLNALFASDGSYTPASGAHVVLTGTSRVKHPTMTMTLGPNSWIGLAGNTWGGSSNTSGTNGISLALDLPMIVGKHITAVRVSILDESGTTQTATLNKVGGVGTATQIATSSASAGTGVAQTLSMTALDVDIEAGFVYTVKVNRTTGSGTDIYAGKVEVDFDEAP